MLRVRSGVQSKRNRHAGAEGRLSGSLSPEADEVDGSRSRHLSAKMGCCQANPSNGALHHGDYHSRP